MRSGEDVAKLCTEDVVWIEPSAPTALNGRDEVARFVDSVFQGFPDARFAPGGDPAISRDGQTAFAVQGGDTFRFRGGLIAWYRNDQDMLDPMRQLGLAPEGVGPPSGCANGSHNFDDRNDLTPHAEARRRDDRSWDGFASLMKQKRKMSGNLSPTARHTEIHKDVLPKPLGIGPVAQVSGWKRTV